MPERGQGPSLLCCRQTPPFFPDVPLCGEPFLRSAAAVSPLGVALALSRSCCAAMAVYSKFLTARNSTMAGTAAAACALLCLLRKRRKAAAAALHGSVTGIGVLVVVGRPAGVGGCDRDAGRPAGFSKVCPEDTRSPELGEVGLGWMIFPFPPVT